MSRRLVSRGFAGFLLVLAAVVLLTASLPRATAQPDPTQPYIYYYADTLNALIVERVDGSDSRVLTELPADQSLFPWLDWSPSGEWVAWQVGRWNGPGYVRMTPYVLRNDGSPPPHPLGITHDVQYMRWSPTADVLFVVDFLDLTRMRLFLFDAASGAVLADFTYDNPASADTRSYPDTQFAWSPDGQQAYALIRSIEAKTMITLSLDGTLSTRVFGEAWWSSVLHDFTQGRVLYLAKRTVEDFDEDTLIVRDLPSGRAVTILEDDTVEGSAYWNADLTYAVLQLRWRDETNRIARTEYQLLDWTHGQVTPLPATLSVRMGPRGDYPYRLWSSDGRFAALVDDENHLSILDAQTGQFHIPQTQEPTAGWAWATYDHTVFILSGIENSRDYVASHYDPLTETLTLVPSLDRGFNSLDFSPDGSTIARLPAWSDMLIQAASGETIPLVHHSLGQAGMQVTGVQWDPTGGWFMTRELIFYAGGGVGPSAITLYSQDGTLRRELGLCFAACAGFVPERALPYLGSGQPRSVLPEPILTLQHTRRIASLAWSPTGDRLAAHGVSRSPDDDPTLTIWQVVDGTAQRTAEYTLDRAYMLHPGACYILWQPDDTLVFIGNGEALFAFDLTTQHTTHFTPPTSTINDSFVPTSPDGLYRVDSSSEGLTITELSSGAIVQTLLPEEAPAQRLTFRRWLPTGHTLLIQRENGEILLWDGSPLRSLGSGANIWGYAYNAQAHLLAAGSLYDRISLLDTAAGEHLADLNWASSALAFNPDGSLLAAGGTELVTIWATADFRH